MEKQTTNNILAQSKEYLRLVGDDDNSLLTGLIERGKAFLQGRTGTDLNFEEGSIKALLLDYVRYSYNNASEYFSENFKDELLSLMFKEGVRVSAIKKTSNAGTGESV
ncbi:MAG: head-tail connector protein [Oscillospiraceae bacterium]